MEILALCHTVIVFDKDGKPNYNSTSPDELALVNAAKFFGFNFKGRQDNSDILLEHDGLIKKFRLLEMIEFTSERQRMSALVQYPDGKIKLLMKGSDTVIGKRLAQTKEN